MHGSSLLGKREVPEAPSAEAEGRLEKATNHTANMYASGKSDNCVVPKKQPNKDGATPLEEDVEERRLTKGNALDSATVEHRVELAVRTQSRNRCVDRTPTCTKSSTPL